VLNAEWQSKGVLSDRKGSSSITFDSETCRLRPIEMHGFGG
jgi:hypothetical protein